jgi:hypothetical protein
MVPPSYGSLKKTAISDAKNKGYMVAVKFLIRQLQSVYMHVGLCLSTGDMRKFWKSICKFYYDNPQTKADPTCCGYTD